MFTFFFFPPLPLQITDPSDWHDRSLPTRLFVQLSWRPRFLFSSPSPLPPPRLGWKMRQLVFTSSRFISKGSRARWNKSSYVKSRLEGKNVEIYLLDLHRDKARLGNIDYCNLFDCRANMCLN